MIAISHNGITTEKGLKRQCEQEKVLVRVMGVGRVLSFLIWIIVTWDFVF